MSISGIGSNATTYASLFVGGASGATASASNTSSASSTSNPSSAPNAAGSSSSGAPDSAMQYLVNYLKESPAKRMEDAWLAQHNLTEQQLAAMPPAQQDAIRKQMAEDIQKKLQQQTGGGSGAYANVVA
jgi:hypothetical protein